MVAVGSLLAVGSYLLVVRHLGGAGAESADGMADVRRTAVALSGVLLGTYLAAASVRGLGGPLLNHFYLAAQLLLTPGIVARLAGQPLPADILFTGRLFLPTNVGQMLYVVLPPYVIFIPAHQLWLRYVLSGPERIAWTDEHLPSLYRDTLLDPSRFDR